MSSPGIRMRKPQQESTKPKVEAKPKQQHSPTETTSDDTLHASPYISETDFVDFLYKPHTLTAGVVLFSVLFAMWKWYHLDNDPISSVKVGLAGAAWAFIVFGTIHLPDGLLVRPHPVFWRFMLSIAVLYMCIMIFLIFQDLKTIKQIFALYDPIHLKEWPEQSYAEDCRMSTPEEPYKFWFTVSDIFLIAHAMGYWAKTVVIRDWRIVTAVSIGFELIEVSLQHQLPNFKECWWDHLIVDVLVCNGGGTLLGLLTLKMFGSKKYHWARLEDIPTVSGKASRVLKQFMPRSFEVFDWHMFTSFKRFAQVCLLLGVMFLNEVNCFTMKNILNQKPTYHLVFMRLVMWGFVALPSLREYYCFITDPAQKRLGTVAWVGSAALLFETMFVAKMTLEGKYFRNPTPANIAIPWCIALALFVPWVVLYFGFPSLRKIFVTRMLLNAMFFGTFLVLTAMCCMSNVDTQWGLKEFNDIVQQYNLW